MTSKPEVPIFFDPPLETVIADAALHLAGQEDEAAVRAVRNMRAGLKTQLPDFPGKEGMIESSVVAMLTRRAEIMNAAGIISEARH